MNGLLSWLMPEQASSFAGRVDALVAFIFLICLFFFVLVVGLGAYFIVKYKRKKTDYLTSPIDDNKKLELAWTVIPSILLVIIFAWGFRVYMDFAVIPPRAMEVKVTGQKWFWTFTYDNGVVVPNEMVVPANKAVKVLLSSKDVLHSFYIPALRVKQDALPNRYTSLWFEANKEGQYPIYCTEYCGTQHSTMVAMIRVVSEDDYQKWLDEKASESSDGMDPVALGKKVYQENACFTCHSIDGATGIGPTWKGTWGTKRKLTNGEEVLIDENYVRESILEPMAKIAAGYQPVMPSYQGLLNENQIEGVIAYMKALKE